VHSGDLSVTQATLEDKTSDEIENRRSGPGYPFGDPTRCNRGMSTETQRDYGLAPQLRARLMGAFLAAIGVSLLVMTVVVVAFSLPGDVLSGLVILVVIGIFTLGFLLGRRWYVVRLDDVGYQVRFVRGVGSASGRWSEVEDLATAFVAEEECVVLRLRDGRSTTIPVNLIEGDREEFVDELKRRLGGRHGNSKR
jgi:hypothetical protein